MRTLSFILYLIVGGICSADDQISIRFPLEVLSAETIKVEEVLEGPKFLEVAMIKSKQDGVLPFDFKLIDSKKKYFIIFEGVTGGINPHIVDLSGGQVRLSMDRLGVFYEILIPVGKYFEILNAELLKIERF